MKKVETHLHTAPNSPCAIEYPRDIARIYKNAGFDTLIVTNHYRKDLSEAWQRDGYNPVAKYLEAYHDLIKYGKRAGLEVWLGVEVNLWRYNVADIHGPVHEILLYGVDERFIYEHPTMYDLTLEELRDLCVENDILMVQAHPYRTTSRPVSPSLVDGYEVYNGNREQNPAEVNAMAREAAIEHGLIMTSGNDFHKRGDETRFGMYIPSIVRDVRGFADCLRDGSARLIEE